MDVRSFSFASLLAFAGPAVAQEAQPQAPEVAPQPELPIEGRWSTEIQGNELVVRLTVVNTGDRAIELLMRKDELSAGVQATIDGKALNRVLDAERLAETMTRRVDLPVYAPLAAKRELLAGTWRFSLPEGYAGAPVRVQVTVHGQNGSRALVTVVNAPDRG